MKIFALLLIFTVVSCATKNSHNDFTTYKVAAESFIKLNKNGADSQALNLAAKNLISLANPIINDFKTKYPDCSELLSFVQDNQESMTKLSHEEIERQFHEGESIPQTDNENCYDPKELIVHPATVVILSRNKMSKDTRVSMTDEISEVLDHMEEIESLLY